MTAFWYKKARADWPGLYVVGIHERPVIVIEEPNGNDTLAGQWAQCCANALNARERELARMLVRELDDG